MRFDEVPLELLERCKAGDGAAFDELLSLIQNDLYAFIFCHLRRHDETDDVLQECLVRLYKHIGRLDDCRKFPWWLMRIAVNQCNTLRARRGPELLPVDEALAAPDEKLVAAAARPTEPRRAMESKRLRTDIDAAIAQLPEKQRSSIVLFEIEDLSIREIAEMTGTSEGAVKFNLHEARKKLRILLSGYLPAHARQGGQS